MLKTILIAVLAAMTVYICLPDMARTEDANKFHRKSTEPVPDQNNLFDAIVGYTSGPGKSPLTEGARLIRTANLALDEYLQSGRPAGKDSRPVFDPHWGKPALAASEEINILCDPRLKACLDAWLAQQETIENAVLVNAVLLSRYQQMQQYTGYHNGLAADVRSPIPELSSFLAINRLYGIMYALMFLSGDRNTASSALYRDIEFVRRLLRQADTLLVKMIALSMLKHDLYVYETLMDMPAAVDYFSEPVPLLSAEERSFLKPLAYEFTLNKKLVSEIKEHPHIFLPEFYYPQWLPFPLLKKNHSINMLFRAFDSILEASKLPADKFYQLAFSGTGRKQPGPGWLSYIYNPVGSILFSISLPDFDKYIIRMHDMNGLITMINLKQVIKRENITVNTVTSFLEEKKDKYSNPYTGDSIHWNSLEQALWTESPASDYVTNKIHLDFGSLPGTE